MDLFATSQEGTFQLLCLLRHVLVADAVLGHRCDRCGVEDKEPAPANPAGNRDAEESLFTRSEGFGHGLCVTHPQPFENQNPHTADTTSRREPL